MASSPLVFTVQRQEAVLVAPAKPTPYELKPLSDIDDQGVLRFHKASVHFYRRRDPSTVVRTRGADPVKIIREALGKALVFYYPLAGRLREGPNGKLVVECTAEGVLFVEADADVRLDQFGESVQLPIPCVDELINHHEYSDIVGSPLVLIQVTRLRCGGFIFACRINHTVADAPGKSQFIGAVTEMARGSDTPSITPVWARELLTARNPPRITHYHPEYDHDQLIAKPAVHQVAPITGAGDMLCRSLFFGPKQMSILKSHLPRDLRRSSSRFEVLLACMWRCRSLALYSDHPIDLAARARFIINMRGGGKNNPPLPVGYYGNAFVFAEARTTVGKLGSNSLSYAVELVKKAKSRITQGYMQSVADLMVLRGRPKPVWDDDTYYYASDLTNSGFDRLDFGWGKPVYSGSSRIVAVVSFYTRGKNSMGEEGTLVTMSLPMKAMEMFVKETEIMMQEPLAMEKHCDKIPPSLPVRPKL